MKNNIKRLVYKPCVKRLFDLGGGICYLNMRGSIYFLTTTKYNSITLLRKSTDYETKQPVEFYNIIHENYLKQVETTRKTNEKKQKYYKTRRIVKIKDKIKQLNKQIKELKNEM